MRTKRTLASILLLALTCASLAQAAIPPMDDNTREASATYVVTGKALEVTKREIDVRNGTDFEYTCIFRVAQVEKGRPMLEGIAIWVKFRRTGRRPSGMTGPQGQNEILSAGTKAKLYLYPQADGTFRLLEPNGWEGL